MSKPPDNILRARRALDGAPGIEIIDDLAWHGKERCWILKLQFNLDAGSAFIPSSTVWYVHIAADYPAGEVVFYPAKSGGISSTFPHQNANAHRDPNLPWRDGRLCLDYGGARLGRRGVTQQPSSAGAVLLWHVQRALLWLTLASQDMLVRPDDPYESPHFPRTSHERKYLYQEDSGGYPQWQGRMGRSGRLHFARVTPRLSVCTTWSDQKDVVKTDEWGKTVVDSKPQTHGYWLALPFAPLVLQYSAPTTWGEFRLACKRMDINLDEHLKRFSREYWSAGEEVALFVGFPIPENFGDDPREVHWEALLLPQLPDRKVVSHFRNSAERLWLRDRKGAFADDKQLQWIASSNISEEHLRVRGDLPPTFVQGKIVLIGCGALGSLIAEILVRKGVRSMTLIDSDCVDVENLRRHILSISDVGDSKSSALARRLNDVSLFATVTAVDASYVGQIARCEANIIIDCTAEDRVAHHLANLQVNSGTMFFSFSTGAQARRLFAFGSRDRFDVRSFEDHLGPLVNEERFILAAEPSLSDPGCHNPTFPAPLDRLFGLAGHAVEFAVTYADSPDAQRFRVFNWKL